MGKQGDSDISTSRFHLLRRANHAMGICAIVVYAVAAARVLFKVLFEANHIAAGLYGYVPHIAVAAFVGLMNLVFPLKARQLGMLVLGLSVFALLSVFLMDEFNILVGYEEWIRRGMPPKPWE